MKFKWEQFLFLKNRVKIYRATILQYSMSIMMSFWGDVPDFVPL